VSLAKALLFDVQESSRNFFGEPASHWFDNVEMSDAFIESLPKKFLEMPSVEIFSWNGPHGVSHFELDRKTGEPRSSQIPLISLVGKRLAASPQVFQRLHDLLRSVDGLHPDEALDELCKVLLLRIASEHDESMAGLFDLQQYKSGAELTSSLRRAPIYAAKTESFEDFNKSGALFEPISLSIAAAVRVAEVIARVTLDDTGDLSGDLFQSLIQPAIRQGMGQYFTPAPIVYLATEILAPKQNESLVDPFCGSAGFLLESVRHARRKGQQAPRLIGVEKSPRMVRIAATDCMLYGLPAKSVIQGDSLFPGPALVKKIDSRFDCVLTNPPFGAMVDFVANGSHDFELVAGRHVPLEIAGLERAVRMLRPGGRLGIVLPDSILDGKRTRHVREWMMRNLELVAILGLPESAFSEFGALHKTSLLIAQKRRDKERDRRVMMAELDSLDENVAREVKASVNAFLDEEPWS
jgi:type I restriction enzyme M protein